MNMDFLMVWMAVISAFSQPILFAISPLRVSSCPACLGVSVSCISVMIVLFVALLLPVKGNNMY